MTIIKAAKEKSGYRDGDNIVSPAKRRGLRTARISLEDGGWRHATHRRIGVPRHGMFADLGPPAVSARLRVAPLAWSENAENAALCLHAR
ncbi:hypothetical protein [Burkholderia singularis]|uniref:hypothetical protein n=1 Tax=Burkholderia singularis TaxID=1503053 RepID=UPI000F774618|nr:hypothetical protein [Burkholderia singularis]